MAAAVIICSQKCRPRLGLGSVLPFFFLLMCKEENVFQRQVAKGPWSSEFEFIDSFKMKCCVLLR